MTQGPNMTTQVVQVPTTPGTPGAGNVPNRIGRVRYIRVPIGRVERRGRTCIVEQRYKMRY